MSDARPIKIAITALGGQGGGVLSNWIVALGEANGFIAQSTSVPGVAQRTGATVYYVELFPQAAAQAKGKTPILALMPVPGDVDIVIAAEFMEAGRAILRGFVTKQTTLIASSHRDYAIAEKINMGDGRQETDNVRRTAMKSAGRFIEADMAAAAASTGAAVSAVLFGALAGAGVLPIAKEKFEDTIRKSGRAVESNLQGFTAGFSIGREVLPPPVDIADVSLPLKPAPPTTASSPLLERLRRDFPPETHAILQEGLKRTLDFQDMNYATLYLDRIYEIHKLDQQSDGATHGWRLSRDTGKHLALWMTYDDAIRVADLKTRRARFARFRDDARAEPDQIVNVSEYLHPRVEEICDLLPATIARGVLASNLQRKVLGALLGKGRRVSTTKLRGFLPLYFMASLRFMRRWGYRFGVEQKRIEDWISTITAAAPHDYVLACEIAGLQRLIKGYGETHDRGLGNFNSIMARLNEVKKQEDPAAMLARLRDTALKDEDGAALNVAIRQLSTDAAA